MAKVKLWLGVLLVFILGVLVGSLGSGFVVKHRLKKFAKEGPPPIMMLKIITSELDLTPMQQLEIEKIVDQSQKEARVIGEKFFPKLTAIVDDSTKQIKEKLTAEQKKKFKVLIERHRFMPQGPPPRFFEKEAGEILADINTQLNLGQEQAEQVRLIIEESVAKRHKMFEKHFPPDPSDTADLRSKMHELDISTEKRLAEILSAQQMEKYRNIQKKHREMEPGRRPPLREMEPGRHNPRPGHFE